jgi:hypothetical protein
MMGTREDPREVELCLRLLFCVISRLQLDSRQCVGVAPERVFKTRENAQYIYFRALQAAEKVWLLKGTGFKARENGWWKPRTLVRRSGLLSLRKRPDR